MMIDGVVLALALLAPQTQALPEQLVITAVVTDKKGKPVVDLRQDEVVVREGTTDQPVIKLEHDVRPLHVALVLDTSQNLGTTYLSDVVPAALQFLKKLPEGSSFAVWGTSDRPRLLVPEGTDLKATEDKLRTTATTGNNAAVDTIVAASQEVAKGEGHRSAVVLVTSATMGDARADVQALLPQASLKPTYIAVEFVQGGGQGDARLEDSIKILVTRTAGVHERVFSAMAVDSQLQKALGLLEAQYRLSWKPSIDPRQTKIEVRVSRKDTKVVQGQRLSPAW